MNNRQSLPQSAKNNESDVIHRASVIGYAVMRELHRVLADPQYPDDVTLGLLMGMTMFLDDKIGPIRCSHLMAQAPGIVLKADAYVAEPQVAHYASMLEAFGEHLIDAAQGRLRLGN